MNGHWIGVTDIVVDVNGWQFHGLSEGPADGELVLLLHGFPEFADTWLSVMHSIAAAGFRTVAVDQRGYSSEGRPENVEEYAVEKLVSDVLGFADRLGAAKFHLVGHDWGGLLAWRLAAEHPERIRSLTVLSTPHPSAFFDALETDEDQKQRSKYIAFFRMPLRAAELFFEAFDYAALRRVYQGKVPEEQVNENIRRLSEAGALTAALNWYRALNLDMRIGPVSVPTLYIWSSQDLALGETAAVKTADYVTGPYRFERLEGMSHWLMAEAPETISKLVLEQILS